MAALTVTAETRHQKLTLGLKASWHSEIPLAHFCTIVNHIPREGELSTRFELLMQLPYHMTPLKLLIDLAHRVAQGFSEIA